MMISRADTRRASSPTASESSDLYTGWFSNTHTGNQKNWFPVLRWHYPPCLRFFLVDIFICVCSKSLQFHTSWKGCWEATVQERWSGTSQDTKSRNGYRGWKRKCLGELPDCYLGDSVDGEAHNHCMRRKSVLLSLLGWRYLQDIQVEI